MQDGYLYTVRERCLAPSAEAVWSAAALPIPGAIDAIHRNLVRLNEVAYD